MRSIGDIALLVRYCLFEVLYLFLSVSFVVASFGSRQLEGIILHESPSSCKYFTAMRKVQENAEFLESFSQAKDVKNVITYSRKLTANGWERATVHLQGLLVDLV